MEPEDDLFEDDFDILDIIEHGFPRRLIFERTSDYEDLPELMFFKRYRLLRPTVLNLFERIEGDLQQNDINQSVSPMNQLLTCLRFYASSGHLIQIADLMKMDTSTVSRIIVRVSEAIARLRPTVITLPETAEERIQVQRDFFDIAAFPRVLGVVDGTHVKIQSPGGDDAEIYRNRKHYFSINVQAIGDAHLKIMDLVVRWPGSTHDSTIFNNRLVRTRFERGDFRNSLLLGDSGYPVRSYFCTPLLNPRTNPEIRYNESIKRTRNSIERVFGVWKRRFPVLAYGMRLKLTTICTVIVACGVLHNIAIEQNEEEPPLPDDIQGNELDHLIEMGQITRIPHVGDGRADVRQAFINNYFANL